MLLKKGLFFLFLFANVFFNCSAGNKTPSIKKNYKLLEVNTMLQLRSLPQSYIDALLLKKFSGILLHGYYKKGDTPTPIIYKVVSTFDTDDNGSIIEVKGIKLYHNFHDVCDMSYYGLKPELNSEQVADLNTRNINTALQKFKKVTIKKKGNYYFRGNRGGEGGSYYRYQHPVYLTFWQQVGDGGGQPGGVFIPSNRVFEMSSGVELRQRPTFMQAYNLITLWNSHNVVIRGGRVVGDLDNHNNRDGGEWGYGLSIQGCNNVLVENFEISKLWGDGINISVDVFDNLRESSNVVFKNVRSTYNRRQGMSICGGKNLRFENCAFANTGVTQFTAPGFGVDLENDIPEVKLENIIFYNCLFEKNYGGVRTVHNGKDIINVNFINCVFKDNRIVNYDSYSAGGVVFQNCDFGYIENQSFGFDIRSSFDIKFLKCKFSNGIYLGKRNANTPISNNIRIDECIITVKKNISQFLNFSDVKNVSLTNNTIIQEGRVVDLKRQWEDENGKNLSLSGNKFK